MPINKLGGLISAAGRQKRLYNQFLRFILVGGLSTLFDGIVYHLLLGTLPVEFAKAIGYLVGMTCSIVCNYRWTFGHSGQGRTGIVLRCVGLYATALLVNVAANQTALAILPPVTLSTLFAFLFAVGVSTIYNFVGMRFWIFRETIGVEAS